MLDNAAKFRGVLERYSCGIIIGPGEAKQWSYNETWSEVSLQMRDAFQPKHFHVWNSDDFWASIERCPDGIHGASHAANTQMFARHLANAIEYTLSAHAIARTFQGEDLDGDRPSTMNPEVQVTLKELLSLIHI